MYRKILGQVTALFAARLRREVRLDEFVSPLGVGLGQLSVEDVETGVREYVAGKVDFRNDAGGNVHAAVGKMSFSNEDLAANIAALLDRLNRMKPSTSKGVYLRRGTLAGTMTPGVPAAV